MDRERALLGPQALDENHNQHCFHRQTEVQKLIFKAQTNIVAIGKTTLHMWLEKDT